MSITAEKTNNNAYLGSWLHVGTGAFAITEAVVALNSETKGMKIGNGIASVALGLAFTLPMLLSGKQ